MYRVVGIATTGKREDELKRTISSLENQVDEVLVYDNSRQKNLTDNGKFFFLDMFNHPIYYFSCDDDLLYPSNYIEQTIEWIEDSECIVSWHGRILKDREKYYGADHFGIRFWQAIEQPYFLDDSGTGVTGFRTDYFNPDIWNSKHKRMSDLVFSLEAAKQGKKIVSPPKKQNWITEQPTKSSIFAEERHGKQTQQIELMKEILQCKHS